MRSYDPFAASSSWWNSWRNHVKKAKANAPNNEGYCQAAVIAHAEYEMARALEISKAARGTKPQFCKLCGQALLVYQDGYCSPRCKIYASANWL